MISLENNLHKDSKMVRENYIKMIHLVFRIRGEWTEEKIKPRKIDKMTQEDRESP